MPLTISMSQHKIMKVVCALRTPKQFYNVQSIAEALLARGARVTAYFDETLSRFESRAPLEAWAKDFPNFSFDFCKGRSGFLALAVFSARELLSYRRFLRSRTQARHWARRWRNNIPFPARLSTFIPGFSTLLKTEWVAHFLRRIEDRVQPVPHIMEVLKKEKPNALIATPTTMHPQSVELEFLKAAKTLGIFSILPVFTWDNLTTKGLIHIQPDLLLAWNEEQARAAESYHGIPRTHIEIIGAPTFDRWFIPTAVEGLTPRKQKTILYVGTSQVSAYDESWLVKELATELARSVDEAVRTALIIFRPHPFNRRVAAALTDIPNIRVLETESRMPNTVARFRELQKEILGADAVCGVSTSAFVDAVIADKPVIALAVPAYRETQGGAEHWRALRESGAVYIAESVAEAARIFTQLFSGADDKKNTRKAFVDRYIRPLGRYINAGTRAAALITRGRGRKL